MRRSGDQVRVRARLINVTEGFRLWADSYERELNDIFAVQDELARAIVTEVQVTLTGDVGAV